MDQSFSKENRLNEINKLENEILDQLANLLN